MQHAVCEIKVCIAPEGDGYESQREARESRGRRKRLSVREVGEAPAGPQVGEDVLEGRPLDEARDGPEDVVRDLVSVKEAVLDERAVGPAHPVQREVPEARVGEEDARPQWEPLGKESPRERRARC